MRILCLIFIWGALVPAACSDRALSQDNALKELNEQVQALYRAGKYAEAIPLAERFVALAREQRGEEHIEFAAAITWLGMLHERQLRFGAAEPLFKPALAITEKTRPDRPELANSLEHLAFLYQGQGRYGEAEPLYKRALSIRETALGSTHPSLGNSLTRLGDLYRTQGRYADAEPLLKRAL